VFNFAAVMVKRLVSSTLIEQVVREQFGKLIEMTKSSGVNMSQRLAAVLTGALPASQNSWLENELRRTVR